MTKKSEEEARAQLEADDRARQRQVSQQAWTSGQTIADPPDDEN
jgi:hypothetical protein